MTTISIILLSIGLAVDAGCVCTSNGLIYKPSIIKSAEIALPFAIFQGIMPLIGYFGIGIFPDELFQYNHIIAFLLLCLVGMKMVVDGIKSPTTECAQEIPKQFTIKIMITQAVSTSIDALTVGITFGNQTIPFMIKAVVIIAAITFVLCFAAVILGKKIGTKLNNKAEVIGGIVLVLIAVKLLMDGL